MCGLAGAFSWRRSASAPDPDQVVVVRDRMAKRGQDGHGLWTSRDGRAVLGHRRLAIIDPQERSLQPMRRGSLAITFNGEIYNYRALRSELERLGDRFATDGDTEVLLAMFERFGPSMLDRLRGMFALAIYDEQRGSLFLARDPYGIKPLYYSAVGGTFFFASQVKALALFPQVPRDLDSAALVGFQIFGSVPEPFTMYEAIRCLSAGHHLTVDSEGLKQPLRYAHVAEVLARSTPGGSDDLQDVVAEAARDSVAAHLVSDVEVGLFLSAGIDSGSLLGLMRDCGQDRVRAFSLAFEELSGTPADEAPLARVTASHYGAEHHVVTVTQSDFDASIEQVLNDMDQPSVDGINSWFVSRAAAGSGLKVVLSGLGGDELLAGYGTFEQVPRTHRLSSRIARVPLARPLARWAARALGPLVGKPKLSAALDHGPDFATAYLLHRAVMVPGEVRSALGRDIAEEGLRRLDPIAYLRDRLEPDPPSDPARVMALESATYMRNQLLRDSDWASMAHSLELRVPFVDWPTLHKIAPIAHRLKGRAGKLALARSPSRPLPDAVVERARTGFTIPVAAWSGLGSPADRLGSRRWSSRVLARFTG